MTKRFFALTLSMAAGAVACLYAGGAFAAAYKVTASGKTETVCSASAAAWKLYNAAQAGTLTDGRVIRLEDDSPESADCAAQRQARAGEQANG